ncbi:MAG TPA: hypothetical protein VHB77_02285 [Planctomycetaceae bacterium]|nr:hypothetical protein [Planctomycetaceae bacterium]
MRTLINVCGPSFSGTTILDLMLGNAPDAFACGEIVNWYRPRYEAHRLCNCSCGEPGCMLQRLVRQVPERRFHETVYERFGVDVIADSSKRFPWVIDTHRWGRAKGFRVVNLLLWKDPLAQGLSHWKRGKPLLNARLHFLRYYQRFFTIGVPYRAIDLEQLTDNPSDGLRQICDAIGIEYTPGRERFWEKQHHQLFGNPQVRNELGQNKQVRQAETFPAEYLAEVERCGLKRFDEETAQLVAVLKRDAIGPGGPTWRIDAAEPPRRVPLWYYAHKLKDHLRPLFPLRPGHPH